jgi:hypothetical protein
MRRVVLLAIAALGIAALPHESHAQGISITPQIGVYIPGDDLDSIEEGAQQVRVDKEGSLALGLNLDFGFLRGSLAYASAATISTTGTSGTEEIGDGKVLAVAADLVLRPLPRIIVQPYLLLGGGLRRADYSYDDEGFDAFPEKDSDFAAHVGVGADLNIGPVGVSAEITDFISKDENDDWKRHDAFGFVGLKLKL